MRTLMLSRENFDEEYYLKNNKDIESAIKLGSFKSGYDHYKAYGHNENRLYRAKQVLNAEELLISNKNVRLAFYSNIAIIKGQSGVSDDFTDDYITWIAEKAYELNPKNILLSLD